MSNEDPGGGRTVFRPSPLQGLKGGQQPAQPQAAPAQNQPPPQMDSRVAVDDVPRPPVDRQHRNPLMVRAAPLLALATSVRSGRATIAMPELHAKASSVIQGLDELSNRYDAEAMRRAKYALAATIDDIALNLPNGGSNAAEWARRSLVVRFFGEAIGGDRFWRLLGDMVASPASFAELLELYHACMGAGFEGRYRETSDGKRLHQEQMQRVYAALEHVKSLSMSELSPRWRGVDSGLRRVGFWAPILFAAGAALLVLLLIYLILRLILAQTGGPAMDAIRAINPPQPLRLSREAAPPPAQDSTQAMRLRTFLAPEIAQKLVVVNEDAATVRVRTTDGQLFRSASDQLDPDRIPLFERIAAALETEPGPIRIEGYTDSDQVRSLSFPNNMALSQARAETVAGFLKQRLSDGSRVSTEGFGDASPVADNSTADGKAQNRRVELVVQRRN